MSDTLFKQMGSVVSTAINTEKTARTAADATLQANIDTEVAARTAAITALTNAGGTNNAAISTEATARQLADTALQGNIDALSANITTVDTAYKAADTALSSAISTETTNRQTAETALQTAISGKLSSTDTAVAATKLAAARTIALTGGVTGSVTFDGSANASITTTVANDSHTHSTYAPVANPAFTGTSAFAGIKETKVTMGANAIDLSAGTFFTKTISAATTFSVSNVPASGSVVSFILELTNAGSAIITWFGNVKWAAGTAPTLTAAGVDILGFYTHDGGVTWRGMVLAKDSK